MLTVKPFYINIFGLTTQPGPFRDSYPGPGQDPLKEVIFDLTLALLGGLEPEPWSRTRGRRSLQEIPGWSDYV